MHREGNNMSRNGLFFILVGPSGAGKNTLMRHVLDRLPDLKQQPTMTTRPIRDDEREGREHYFVTPEQFQEAQDDNALLEFEQVHLQYMYGTPRHPVENALETGQDRVADIECHGAKKVHDAFPDNVILIFVTPSSLDILKQRIVARGNITPEELAERLARARFELTYATRADYILINDHLETAYEDLYTTILNERHHQRGVEIDVPTQPRHTITALTVPVIRAGNKVLVRDSNPDTLPTFLLSQHGELPHMRLIVEIESELGQTPVIHSDHDDRFDFPAPNHVTISGAAPDITLTFFYECELNMIPEVLPDGWAWRPADEIELPETLEQQIRTSP